jgi:hypothetical protein
VTGGVSAEPRSISRRTSSGGDNDGAWLGIGFATADGGGVLLLIALIVGGVGLARARRGAGDRLLRVSGAIALVLLAVYVVTVWAMAKPS